MLPRLLTALDQAFGSRTVDKLFMLWYNISKYITDFETNSIMSFNSLLFLYRQHVLFEVLIIPIIYETVGLYDQALLREKHLYKELNLFLW